MCPVLIIRKNPNNTYSGIEVLNTPNFNQLIFDIKANYINNSNNTIDKLIKLGNVDRLGLYQSASPIVKKYGYDFSANLNFLKLPLSEQEQLVKREAIYQNIEPDYTNSLYLYKHDKSEAPQTITSDNLYNCCANNLDANIFILIKNNQWYILSFNDDKSIHLDSVNNYYNNYILK